MGGKYLVDQYGDPITSENPLPVSATLTGSLPAGSNVVGKVNKNARYILTTILNAGTVAAGQNTGNISIGADGTESEVWLYVNIDKQPWSLSARTMNGAALTTCLFPEYNSHANTYTQSQQPATALILGSSPVNQGLTAPTTISQAKDMILPIDATEYCRVINNHATDSATITIKALRVWR